MTHHEALFERCPFDQESPYVLVARAMAQDCSISPKAKGVLLYLISLPPDWKIYHSQLKKALGVGEEYLNSALEELIAHGYADRTRERVKGVFQPYRYKMRQLKKCSPNGKTQSGSPNRESRPGFSGPENPALQSIDRENIQKEQQQQRVRAREKPEVAAAAVFFEDEEKEAKPTPSAKPAEQQPHEQKPEDRRQQNQEAEMENSAAPARVLGKDPYEGTYVADDGTRHWIPKPEHLPPLSLSPSRADNACYATNKNFNLPNKPVDLSNLCAATTPPRNKIHPLLLYVDIDQNNKIEITQTYFEDSVLNALAWVYHPETVVKTTLAQAIKWACRTQPEIPKPKDVKDPSQPVDYSSHHRSMWREIFKHFVWPDPVLKTQVNEGAFEYLEVTNGKMRDKIYYKDKSFLEQIESFFRKLDAFNGNFCAFVNKCKDHLSSL